MGLEPATAWLQIRCSTNWATPAILKEHCLLEEVIATKTGDVYARYFYAVNPNHSFVGASYTIYVFNFTIAPPCSIKSVKPRAGLILFGDIRNLHDRNDKPVLLITNESDRYFFKKFWRADRIRPLSATEWNLKKQDIQWPLPPQQRVTKF